MYDKERRYLLLVYVLCNSRWFYYDGVTKKFLNTKTAYTIRNNICDLNLTYNYVTSYAIA